VQLCVGTSGFSYDGWKESFYPPKLPAKERLRFYATKLPAVEINNTFYRMPGSEVVEGWAAQVPGEFRFAIKASRRITHQKRLKDVGDELSFLLGRLEALGPKLGVVLVQTPPNLRADLERLDRFLDLVPDGTPLAFEPRHESWHDEPVLERLRTRGCALVHADTADEAACGGAPTATAPFGYLRLRRDGYDERELREWALRVRAQPWERAFVFFKHEDAGVAPALAARFRALFESARMAPARRAREERSRDAG